MAKKIGLYLKKSGKEEMAEKKHYYSESGIKVDIPFVPSSQKKINLMMTMLGDVKGKKAADLGCGDGRLILELAKMGAEAHGYELEPERIKEAKTRLAAAGQTAVVHDQDFFHADLSEYQIITLYGITSMMAKLEDKLLSELKPGSMVVSNTFEFPNWKHEKTKNDVYLYRVD